jgi:hypothetical protein
VVGVITTFAYLNWLLAFGHRRQQKAEHVALRPAATVSSVAGEPLTNGIAVLIQLGWRRGVDRFGLGQYNR